jgi:septum formation protein
MSTSHLVLASASPRRRELLVRDGFAFDIVAADLDERMDPGESPVAATCRLAVEKACAVRTTIAAAEVILAADTTVVLGGRIFGKPTDEDDAVSMLAQLAGRSHMVVTGWAILPAHGEPSAGTVGYTKSWVRFRELTSREIRDYIAAGESMDKAGAYAVQGVGKRLIAGVIGSVDNVIGLPADQVARALGRYGIYSEEAILGG